MMQLWCTDRPSSIRYLTDSIDINCLTNNNDDSIQLKCRYIFTIASYLIGVFIFATIVGQVGNVITNRNASRLEFERLLDTAKLYMRHHKVPRSMQRRVQRWYDYSWSRYVITAFSIANFSTILNLVEIWIPSFVVRYDGSGLANEVYLKSCIYSRRLTFLPC